MNEIDKILARESVELLEAMHRGEAGARERLALWMKQSRRHAEHYLMTTAFERELDRIQFDPELSISSSVPAANVVALHSPQERITPARQRRWSRASWRTAAAAVVGVAVISGVYWQSRGNEYITRVGEQLVIELSDGSIVHLNTNSRVLVRLSDQARDIHLTSGEALFKVHADPTRPFRVHTDDAVIQAIGTEFNVYNKPQATTVAVLEGRIRVTGSSETDLTRGEGASIDPAGKIARKTIDITRAAVWRQRRLIFAGTPLTEIVAEFNRYNRTPRLVLQGNQGAERVFSGVFDVDDPESLIQLLRREPGIEFVKKEDRIVVKVGE